MSPHHSDQMSRRSQVSNICSLKVFSKCICLCHCLCIWLFHCLFAGQVMSPHHSDQMSRRSHVSGIALWRCSLTAFVFVIVFVFVFVFFVVFVLVRSCLLIALIKCLEGHKSLIFALWKCSLNVFVFVIAFVFVIVFFWSGRVSSSLWSNVSKVTSL